MDKLREIFNKLASDDPKVIIGRDLAGLPSEKQDLFLTFRAGLKELEESLRATLKDERVGRTLDNANALAMQPRLEPGTPRPLKPILEAEVIAMMRRAEEEHTALSQLTPRNSSEIYIQQGNELTLNFEARKRKELEDEHAKLERKMLDDLMGLEEPSLGFTKGGHGIDEPEIDLSDEFNTASGQTL